MSTASPRWHDLTRSWLLDEPRFRLLLWIAPLLVLVPLVAAPLYSVAALVVALLFISFWRRPQIVVLLLIALMGNVKVNYYAGFFTVFPEYLVIVLAASVWVLRWMEGQAETKLEERTLLYLFGAFLLAGCLSFVNAIHIERVFARVVLIALEAVTFYLVMVGIRSLADLSRALRWLEWSAFAVAAYGIVQMIAFFVGIDTGLGFLEKYGNPEFHYGVGAPVVHRLSKFFRANSFFNDSNILGGYLAVAMSVVLALRIHHGEQRRRIRAAFETGLLMLMGVCLLLTLSRSGFIAMLGGCAVVLAFMPAILRSAGFWVAVIAGFVGAGVAASAIGVDPWLLVARLGQSIDLSDVTSRVHHDALFYGLALLSRFPVTGVGLGNFGYYYGAEVDVYYPNMMSHSAPLSYLADTGLIGGATFIALVVAIARRPWRALRNPALRQTRRDLFAYTAGLFGALIALNAANLFYDYYMRTFIWVTSGLAVAAARLWESEASTGPGA